MSNKKIDLAILEIELAALRNALIEMRTVSTVDSGRKSRISTRKRISRLLAIAQLSKIN